MKKFEVNIMLGIPASGKTTFEGLSQTDLTLFNRLFMRGFVQVPRSVKRIRTAFVKSPPNFQKRPSFA